MSGLGPGQEAEPPPKMACARVGRLCRPTPSCGALVAILILLVAPVIFIFVALLRPCNNDLVIRLKDFTVRDMVVIHSNSTLWQMTININLKLALHNPNSWASLWKFSLREVNLSICYIDSSVFYSDVVYQRYKQRSLSTSSSHEGIITLTGDRTKVLDVAGVALEAQLLRNDNVTFVLAIQAQYGLDEEDLNRMVNHKICEVVVETPQQTSIRSKDKGFLNTECVDSVTEEL